MSRPSPQAYRQVEAFAELVVAEESGRLAEADHARGRLLDLGYDVRPLGTSQGVKPLRSILDRLMERIGGSQ